MVPAGSRRISRVPRYSGAGWPPPLHFAYGAVTLYGRAFLRVPLWIGFGTGAGPTTPGAALTPPRFGLLRVRSPLLAQSLLFSLPAGTEMFQFPAFALRQSPQCRDLSRRVSPFGHPRVTRHLPLTAAFRSLSRPSSPPRATGIPHAPLSAFLFVSPFCKTFPLYFSCSILAREIASLSQFWVLISLCVSIMSMISLPFRGE